MQGFITPKSPTPTTTHDYDTTIQDTQSVSTKRHGEANVESHRQQPPFLYSMFNGSLRLGGVLILFFLLITACFIRLTIPHALLWDSLVALIIILLYKNSKINTRMHKGLEFLGKHSFNIFLFHTFIYYLYFSFVIYWSRNPIIIFISLLLSCIAISIGIEKLKEYIGFYRLSSKIDIYSKNC